MIDYSDDDDYDEGDDDDKDVDVKEYSAHLYSGSSLSTGARTMVVVRPPSCEIKLRRDGNCHSVDWQDQCQSSFNIARKITTSPHSASSRFSAASMSA